jgi:hypothetical protein
VKRRVVAALIGVAVTLGTVAAVAQRPQPLPSNTDNSSSHNLTPLPRIKYPMPASQYELVIGRLLESVRKLSGHKGYSAGDVNKVVFDVKLCAANAEADGVVTLGEANYCNAIINTLSLDNREPAGGRPH